MFLGSLLAVAERSDEPLTEEMRLSLESSLRYFRDAAPKHTADEEESLFPRLRQIKSPEMQNALAELDALEKDHRWAEPLHAAVEKLGHTYLETGTLPPSDSRYFREAIDLLAAMYRRHIEIEDRDVFPVAARLLAREEKDAVAREMAERRNIKPIKL
jgi:hemerythrin-like domain-containing protein